MAKGYTLVVVEGGLARDPEVKFTPNGAKVATFGIGFERGYGDKARTCWIDCVCFREPKSGLKRANLFAWSGN